LSAQSNPQRTCIGCKRQDDQGHLLRLVVTSGDGIQTVTVDAHRRFPGRGAWLHPVRGCMALALKRRAFNRAFRGTVDTRPAEGYFQALDMASPADQVTTNRPHESGSEN
jgi:predicted RNA-binding protein YlxR (DUF448 family)